MHEEKDDIYGKSFAVHFIDISKLKKKYQIGKNQLWCLKHAL